MILSDDDCNSRAEHLIGLLRCIVSSVESIMTHWFDTISLLLLFSSLHYGCTMWRFVVVNPLCRYMPSPIDCIVNFYGNLRLNWASHMKFFSILIRALIYFFVVSKKDVYCVNLQQGKIKIPWAPISASSWTWRLTKIGHVLKSQSFQNVVIWD